jgi:bla regulator protein BlaR1
MSRLLDFIGGDFIYALGWTLIHSIWQVGLIAVIVALIMMRVEAKKSATRYAIFMGALLAVPIMSFITFYRLYSGIEASAVASASLRAENPYLNEAITTVSSNLVNPGTWEIIMSVLRPGPENLQYVVMVWFAGVLMLSIRFMGGVWAINRLRGYATSDISADWKKRMAGLSDSLGIRRFVQLAESARVTVPMTAGWIKPIILLPIGMLTNMPPAHIEMILLHELSHIRRHDYLMNVVQGIVEIMFFYHPAIWWLSDGVRTEREHCCDDRVLSLKGDRLAYAKALHAAAAAIMPKAGSILPKAGLALNGENGELLERIHRILNKEMKNTIYSTRFTASTVLVVGLCLFLMMAPSATKNESPTTLQSQEGNSSAWSPVALDYREAAVPSSRVSSAENDSIPPKNRKVTIVKNQSGAAPIPPLPVMPALPPITAMPPMPDSLRMAALGKQMEELSKRITASFSNFNQAEFEQKMAQYEREMEKWAELMERDADKWSAAYERDMDRWGASYAKEMEAWAAQYERELETKMNSKEWKDWERSMEKWAETYEKNWNENYSKKMEGFERSMEAFGKSMEAFGAKMEAWAKRMAEMESEIKHELVRDGIIQSTNEDINLKMTKDGMYIDGRKVSDKLTEKYRGIIRKYNKGDYSLKDLEYTLQINN